MTIASSANVAETEAWLPVADDWLALAVILMLLLCAGVEARMPYLRPGLRLVKDSYLTNLTLFLFNDITLSVLSIPALYLVAERFSDHGVLNRLPDAWPKYVLSFLLMDLAMYGWHWLTHQVDGLWRFHRVHHSDPTLNVTTGLRFHGVELCLEALVRILFIAIIGVGAGVVLVMQTVMAIFVLFHHTNVTFPHERRWGWIFIVPRLHRVHHSVLRAEHDSNYGAVFSWWDRLFGTLRDQEPTAIGLADAGVISVRELLGQWSRLWRRPGEALDWLQGALMRGNYLLRPVYARQHDKGERG
ncbi:hypothetical protein JCM19379_13430 [Methyloparacoccus murrellii]